MYYEPGLRRLQSQLPVEAQSDFLIYEARLRENLDRERRFGSTESVRAERLAVVDALNALAIRHLSISYNQLCLLAEGSEDGPHAQTIAPTIDQSKVPKTTTVRRVFISYNRDVEPDEPLALSIREALIQAGHLPFIDQKDIKVGFSWAEEIQRQIEACDFIIILLSESSIHSEMLTNEVMYAHKHFLKTGKARLLPVRVNYFGALSYDLSHYLAPLQYATWSSAADTIQLMTQLFDAINSLADLPCIGTSVTEDRRENPPRHHLMQVPRPSADPRFVDSLREPGGAVKYASEFYIERVADERLHRELGKPSGTTTTIRAPRQTGKSSLLIRGINAFRVQHRQLIFLDLQSFNENHLQTLDTLLHHIARLIATKLRLDLYEVERAWESALGPSDKLTYLFEDYVLPKITTKMILAIDEADRILGSPFHDSFFGLIRFWHNSRAMNDLWEKLDIIMVISTEPHLLISDPTQSPFNVGLKLLLEDFNVNQVQELNYRYRLPASEADTHAMIEFLNGHPYLTHKALYTLVTDGLSWAEFVELAKTDSGPVGDHLRRYLWMLRAEAELQNALKQIILYHQCQDEAMYYRLLQAGLIKGPSSKSCTCRCQLYTEYFKDKLG